MTVKELKELLAPLPDELLVGVLYDLADWPGECWASLQNPQQKAPIEMTKVGSADPDAGKPHLMFDVRP